MNLFNNFFNNLGNSFQKGTIGQAFAPRDQNAQTFTWNASDYLGPRDAIRSGGSRGQGAEGTNLDTRGFSRKSDDPLTARFLGNRDLGTKKIKDSVGQFLDTINQPPSFAGGFGAGGGLTAAAKPQPFQDTGFNFNDPGFRDLFMQNQKSNLLQAFSHLMSRNELVPLLSEYGIDLAPTPTFNTSMLDRFGPNVRI